MLSSTNFYATNFELGSISPLFLHQLSRSRWRIDTEIFQTITTDCHLKHPAVHQNHRHWWCTLTMIRFLAYTLSLVFYHRQVRKPCPPKMRYLSRGGQALRLLVPRRFAQDQLIPPPRLALVVSGNPSEGVRPDALTPYSFRL